MFKVYHFKALCSTNDKAASFKENSVVIAEKQTKGRGRFKRAWSSETGGIYMSIVLPKTSMPQLYTFIASLSALKSMNSKDIKIKWPNDLIYKNKKLCGILTEAKNSKTIVGIGINTNNIIPLQLKSKATSLSEIEKKKISNKAIIQSILKHFESYLNPLNKNKIINEWKKNSFIGSEIKAKTMGGNYKGTAYGIDKDGFLIIKGKGNKKIRIIEGDIIITSLKRS